MLYTSLLLLLVNHVPTEKEIYLPGGIWHQYPTLQANESITLVGHSSGAHSAVFMAFDPANKGKIKKVKLISGVYRIGVGARLVARGALRGMSNREASPLFHIPPASKDSPEFEIYYATLDLPTLRHQAHRFYKALICNGYKAVLIKVRATHTSIPCKLGYR